MSLTLLPLVYVALHNLATYFSCHATLTHFVGQKSCYVFSYYVSCPPLHRVNSFSQVLYQRAGPYI